MLLSSATQRQKWSKIARITTVEKTVDQCRSFEPAAVINRQPVTLLEDTCNTSILSRVSDNICKIAVNTLQFVQVKHDKSPNREIQ